MEKIKSHLNYFTKAELTLWAASVALIAASFLLFDRVNYLTLLASLVGATSLIYTAKGNPIGQVLIILFSLLYGVISFSFQYYGEMITYLGMTAPMSLFALLSWVRNPYNGNKAEVEINSIRGWEIGLMAVLTAVVTVVFHGILRAFHTANLLPSTLSVATSFVAVYLTFRRSAYYAAAYAANDLVLIVLWVMAALEDPSYLSVVICFVIFFVNDLYGFLNWQRMHRRQKTGLTA